MTWQGGVGCGVGRAHKTRVEAVIFHIIFFSASFFLFLKGTGFEIETVFHWLPIQMCPDIITFYSPELLGFKIKQKPKPHANMRSSEAA